MRTGRGCPLFSAFVCGRLSPSSCMFDSVDFAREIPIVNVACERRSLVHALEGPMFVNWRGVFPAATTEFGPDHALDLPATLTHLDRMIEAGVHGMIMLGTVGENGTLEPDEKLAVLSAAVDYVAGRVPVLAGVAESSTVLACPFAAAAGRARSGGFIGLPALVYKDDPRQK